MPQERIHMQPFDVRVGWSRDQNVQVGVGEYEDRSLLWVLFGDEENRQRLGKALPELLADAGRHTAVVNGVPQVSDEFVKSLLNLIESKEEVYTYSSVWASLNYRQECNQLIKLIRKARDQAFGRDE